MLAISDASLRKPVLDPWGEVDPYWDDITWKLPLHTRLYSRAAPITSLHTWPVAMPDGQRRAVLRALAWLYGYGHMTVSQLRRVGVTPAAIRFIQELGGALEQYSDVPQTPGIMMLSPSRALLAWTKRLSTADWVGVCGGYGLRHTQPAHARHNILMAEMAMRLALHHRNPPAAIFGEPYSAIELMLPDARGSHLRGDATVIRPDGLKLVVELTSSLSQSLYHKIPAWIQLLAEYPDRGIAVVFAIASAPYRVQTTYSKVRQLIDAALAQLPRHGRLAVQPLVLTCLYKDLFPQTLPWPDTWEAHWSDDGRLRAANVLDPEDYIVQWEPDDETFVPILNSVAVYANPLTDVGHDIDPYTA